ncbi:preprotein translocase, SecA subunit [Candidatus Pelagibacter sp. HTCC7211]|uniref:preprotein translocase subunit SecA n=1 Tax=Pelagibacter sp. (strain HTCC7211) TaxID=439493 RepID=UPI000183B014|nr:preprotein translocase subunit SecA [Candidatus Pelagibacter sp. HTCC7211]EDZ60935.1 preprotein translocase, SecA subunit [Candidatus Pelagibacter sp. HTCC7211]MBD1151402.1 preprotein translocase subunit SecA [Pelagibacterales bacterium SAG-MED25]
MFNPLNLISKFIKSSNQKELDRISNIVTKINSLEDEFKNLDDLDFPKKTSAFKDQIKNGKKLDEILPEAFALVREASRRTRNERHFDVQIIGGVVLHEGKIAEMRTGEGKTLTITLAAYLNALTEKGVHIVTVNDYLAKRDSIDMGQIYNFLGLTSGYINNDQNDEDRKKNYSCDITYATNSELGFDYLRDNMKFSEAEMVQREHAFSIVDEIDSCLIDEARTPLVISGSADDKTAQYLAIDKLVKQLNDKDYEIDEKDRGILLTNDGINNVEKIFSDAGILKNNNFYDPENLGLVHHVNQALRANHLFEKGKDYIVKDESLKIIDELTGRILEGRRFGDGLHQALEAKEKITIQAENQTLASITYQNYFKLYKKMSGCTGTAATESEEFFEIYNLPVVVIPTNNEMIRKDYNDQIFRTEGEKNDAIIERIVECHNLGQPILIFTSSINKSEIYSKLLSKKNIKHVVLNAKNHANEAEIIANAGKENSVIITTSISGRGVDIQLGGKKGSIQDDQLKIDKAKIKTLGGLFVIGTERMESRRVDNQARGRAGRQGDEGSSIFYVSLEDDLMRIFGSESMNNMLEKLGLKDGESIDHPWINKALERAQQKVEARNFDIRKTLIKFDNVLNDQRHVVFSQRKNAMNSKNIFEYSDEFLKEISQDIVKLKIQKLSNPKSNEFSNRLRQIVGKSFEENEFKELISSSDNEIKEKILNKFKESRNDRINLLGEDHAKEIEKRIFLQSIDLNWKSHIQYLEQLRQVIGLRSYGQRDPLIEYKKEAFELFSNLLEKLKLDFVTILMNLKVLTEQAPEQENKNSMLDQIKKGKKIGRNEPCYCGSGKKFKHCCGAL